MYRAVLIVLLVFHCCAAHAQGGRVHGRLMSTGTIVPYANILVKETRIGTSSDPTGRFTITGVTAGQHVLLIRAVGFEEKGILSNG